MKMISAFLLVLSAAPLFGQQKEITLQDLIQTNPVRPGVLSPDGKSFAVIEKGQIALKPASGGPAVPVTTDPAPKSEVSWSPDSRKLAYVSKGDIWIIAESGGEPVQLTDGVVGPGDPRGATDHFPKWN